MHWLFHAPTRGYWSIIPSRHSAVALLATALACAAAPAPGADAGEPLRLADVLEVARQANPQLSVARQRVAAMRQVPAQVSAYDDPTLSWEGWDIPNSLRVDQAENNIFRLAQKVPWPGKRTLAGTVAEHEADAAEEEVHVTQLDLTAEVKRAYYDLWLAHQKRAILGRD